MYDHSRVSVAETGRSCLVTPFWATLRTSSSPSLTPPLSVVCAESEAGASHRQSVV